MKKYISRIFIVLLAAVIFASTVQAKEKGGPEAVMTEMSFDFEEIKEGSVIEHSFTVINKGASTLEIMNVKPDCGCTTSEFDKKNLPGKEGRITFKVDTKGFKEGIKKNIRVLTNDPDNEMIVLRLEAFIRSSILISKEYIVFKGTTGEIQTESIDIKAQEKTSLNLEVIEYTLNDKVDFSMKEIENGSAYRLNFKNRPNQSGTFSGQLRLKTNYPEKPEISIKIRGRFIDE